MCGTVDGGERDYNVPQSRRNAVMLPLNVQGIYSAGGEMNVKVNLFAGNNGGGGGGGHFEFSVCPLTYPAIPTEECFERYPLEFVKDDYYGAVRDENYPSRAHVPYASAFQTNNGGTLRPVLSAEAGPGGASMMEFSYTFKLPQNVELNTNLDELERSGVPNGDGEGSTFSLSSTATEQQTLTMGQAFLKNRHGKSSSEGTTMQSYAHRSSSSGDNNNIGGTHDKDNERRALQSPIPAPAPPPQWIATQTGTTIVTSSYETVLISSLSTDGNGTTTIITLNGDITVIEGGPKVQASSTLTYGSKAIYGSGLDLEELDLPKLPDTNGAIGSVGDQPAGLGASTRPSKGVGPEDGGVGLPFGGNAVVPLNNAIPSQSAADAFAAADGYGGPSSSSGGGGGNGVAVNGNPSAADNDAAGMGAGNDSPVAAAAAAADASGIGSPISATTSLSSSSTTNDPNTAAINTPPNQKYVLLRWHYVTARDCHPPGYTEYQWPTSWGQWTRQWGGECGTKQNGGSGNQQEYWNCAEIMILGPTTATGSSDGPLLSDATTDLQSQASEPQANTPIANAAAASNAADANEIYANDDQASTTGTIPVKINVILNDIGSSLIVTDTRPGRRGICSVTDDNQVEYTANGGFAGRDRCAYRVCLGDTNEEDGDDEVCHEAWIYLEVYPSTGTEDDGSSSAASNGSSNNSATAGDSTETESTITTSSSIRTIVAVDDGIISGLNRPIRIDVAANDEIYDENNGSSMSAATSLFAIVTAITINALHGTCQIIVTSNNQVLYTPNANFQGWDHCTYRICLTGDATSVRVNGVNDDDAYCDEGKVKIKVLGSILADSTTAATSNMNDGISVTLEEETGSILPDKLATATSNTNDDLSKPEPKPMTTPEEDTVTVTLTATVTSEVFAMEDKATTTSDTPMMVDVTANDYSSSSNNQQQEQRPLIVTKVNVAKHGTCQLVGNRVRYIPPASGVFEGWDKCAYIVCIEGGGECNKGKIDIRVLPTSIYDQARPARPTEQAEQTDARPIRPIVGAEEAEQIMQETNEFTEQQQQQQQLAGRPTNQDAAEGKEEFNIEMVYAEDEIVVTSLDTPIVIHVTNNDFVKGMGPLTLMDTGGADHGRCKLTKKDDDDNRAVRYTPEDGFVGTDHCVYKVCQNDMCDEGIVAIKVTDQMGMAKKPLQQQQPPSSSSGLVTNHESSGGLSLLGDRQKARVNGSNSASLAVEVDCGDNDGEGRHLRGSRRVLVKNPCIESSVVTTATAAGESEITYTTTHLKKKITSSLSYLDNFALRLGKSAIPSDDNNEDEYESYTETVISIPASADAVIMPGFPDKCFGSVPSMLISSASSNAGHHETMLMFQTSHVDYRSVCDGGSFLSSATIYLYSLGHSSQGGTFVTTSDSSWSENDVTWHNAPLSDGIVLSDIHSIEAKKWYGVDVSSALILGETLSIRILSNDKEGAKAKNSVAQYASRDHSDLSLKPVLNITCVSLEGNGDR